MKIKLLLYVIFSCLLVFSCAGKEEVIIEDEVIHIPADGQAWIHDDTKYHTVTNGGETPRISLVTTLLN